MKVISLFFLYSNPSIIVKIQYTSSITKITRFVQFTIYIISFFTNAYSANNIHLFIFKTIELNYYILISMLLHTLNEHQKAFIKIFTKQREEEN